MTYRSGLVVAGLMGMAVLAGPVAQAAPLLSADVQISSPGFFTTYGPVGVTPPASHNDAANDCGFSEGGGCSYSFSLSSTGFTFTATCDADVCDNMPAFTVMLTNMVFQSGEVLANAQLQEVDNTNGFGTPPFGNVVFTGNSVTLSVAAFLANCFGNLQETVSFTTRAITTETDVPEPSTLSLLGLGALGLAWWRRERRRTA